MRFSTSTLIADDEVVPWLAATGELAYSPQSPPERDYFFQYSWVIPRILREGAHKRRHYWFGDPSKDHPKVRLLFRFWNEARRGAYVPLFVSRGAAAIATDVTAPVAAYRHHDVHPSGHTAEQPDPYAAWQLSQSVRSKANPGSNRARQCFTEGFRRPRPTCSTG